MNKLIVFLVFNRPQFPRLHAKIPAIPSVRQRLFDKENVVRGQRVSICRYLGASVLLDTVR